MMLRFRESIALRNSLLARCIHEHSKQSHEPYLSTNCAAVSTELAESELFGHERGSFAGALGAKD
jgi:transcriptional regulator with GAF, ATPase, and Fis domain